MEGESPKRVLARAERKLFFGAILVVLLSSQISDSPLCLMLLWCASAGLLCAYFLFRILSPTPNVLLHMKRPSPAPSHDTIPLHIPTSCAVCNQLDCKRHESKRRKEYMNPWDDLTVPYSIDCAVSEILEIVMQRFVYSWHRNLAPASESIEDEIRVAIRHAAATILRRARRLDLPYLVTHKFLQVIATHINFYVKARRKLPTDATMEAIEAAVFKEYGDHTHSAMRGGTGNLHYFRHVGQALLPLLLPQHMLQSKIIYSFVQELFAAKIFVPAMNFAAKPDFINKLLLIIFDKNSKLEPVFGPASKEVPLLSKWASTRSRYHSKLRPLNIPLPELLDPQHNLYIFMQFMKAIDDIYILNLYLTLSDLKQKVSIYDRQQAEDVLDHIDTLYKTFLIPSSPNYVPLDPKEVSKIATVLSNEEWSAVEKIEELKKMNVFGRLKGFIYNELLMKIYYPRFLQSYLFYEHHLGKKCDKVGESVKSKGDRWRQKTKQFKRLSSHSTSSEKEEIGTDAVAEMEEEESIAPSKPCQIPKHVQIIDIETQMDGIRPYTNYIIMVRMEGETKRELVKRRYKEFVGLDTKLRQFHGDIQVQLPSKKAFRNMDKSFVEARCKELTLYLGTLIITHKIQDSQILASFLSPHSDPSLFLSTVTEKMIKAVPNVLKRDKTQQHLEELLQTLLLIVEPPSNHPSPETVASATALSQSNQEARDQYLEEAADDLSDSASNRFKPWLNSASSNDPPSESLKIDTVMELLVFVAVSVYHVSSPQLITLLLTKLLAQETIQTLAYNFVTGKVDLMLTEAHIIRLIHLLRDNLFFSKDPPRLEEDMRHRFVETLECLLNYPNSLVINAIGGQRFQEGTALIFEGLQCRELNKQLFFNLLDIILSELFPELAER